MAHQITQILDTADTTSDVFTPPGGVSFVLLSDHAGGTWQLQVRTPDGDWIDDEMEFTENGIQAWYGSPALAYRLNGGTAGAKAWVVND